MMNRPLKALIAGLLLLCSMPVHADDGDYEKGIHLFRQRNYRAAVSSLEQFVAERPDAAAYYILGYAQYELRNYNAAKDAFEQAFLIDPEINRKKIPDSVGLQPEDRARVRELLDLSGIREQAAGLATAMLAAIPQGKAGHHDAAVKEFPSFIQAALSTDRVYAEIVAVFEERFHRSHYDAMLQWFRSPLGRKMSRIEVAAMSVESIRDAEAGRDRYFTDADAKRRDLVRRLAGAVKASEQQIGVTVVMFRELTQGMQARLPEAQRMKTNEMEQLLSGVQRIPKDALIEPSTASLAYTYRALTDREVEGAVSAYETAAGQWMVDTMQQALVRSLGRAAREIGEKLGTLAALKKLST